MAAHRWESNFREPNRPMDAAESPERCPADGGVFCFGHRSALEVLHGLPRVRSLPRQGALPPGPPTAADLRTAMARIEKRCPNTVLSYPVHGVSCSCRHSRASDALLSHSLTKRLPPSALLVLGGGVSVAAPPLALAQMARELSFPRLVEVGYGICGTYRAGAPGSDARFDAEPLDSVRSMRAFLQANSHLDGSAMALRALRYVADGSASPRETKLAVLLALPQRYGGYGLGVPQMNREVHTTAEARRLCSRATLRCDLSWLGAKIDVEYNSRSFHQGEASRIGDSRRANALMAMGFTVVAVTNDELDSLSATDVIARTVARALGMRWRTTVKDYRSRRIALRRQLGLPLEPGA